MRKFGWKRSIGETGVPVFHNSPTLQRLGAANAYSNLYIIPSTSVPIFDQGQVNSCVANSSCAALEILANLANGTYTPLSRLFAYWNARVVTGSTGVDQGTYIHDCFNQIAKLGVAPESTFPYSSSVFQEPNLQSYQQGNDNTISAFYEITSQGDQRIADINTAVLANHPVVFGANVSNSFENYNGDPTVVFTTPTDVVGGHAQILLGTRTNSAGTKEFLVRNSWGASWGNTQYPGCSWWSAEYITDSNTDDIFVPTQMPNLMV